MIEKQVQDAYNKFKKKVVSGITSDAFFTYYQKYMKGGNRTYVQHNVEKNKYIDEEWVNTIISAIPHMQKIINNPRSYMKSEETITPIELARKISSNSVKHLASNTHFISKIDKDGVRPSKILTTYNDQTFDIYENRFIMTLLRNVERFVDIRYYMLGGKVGNEFSSEFEFAGQFSQNDENTSYSLKLRVDQGANYMGAQEDSGDIFQKLEQIRKYIQGFNNTEFVKAMQSVPLLRPPINKTNMLMKQPDYRKCFELWEFISSYTKAGYKIDVVDSNPKPSEEFIEEAEVVMLLNYLVLKSNMSEFQETKKAEFSNVRTYEPNIIQKYDTILKDAQDIDDYKTLVAALKEGKSAKVENMIRSAIERALDIAEQKIELEMREMRDQESAIIEAIKRALTTEEKRKVEADKQIKESIRDAEVAMALQKIVKGIDPDYNSDDELGSFFSDDTVNFLKNRSTRKVADAAPAKTATRKKTAKNAGGASEDPFGAFAVEREPELETAATMDDEEGAFSFDAISYDEMDDLSIIRHLLEDKKPSAKDGE